jgi:O-antigen ligase/tetratricopeptide (TPR) repeat protein
MESRDTKTSVYKQALEISWLAVIFLVPLFFNPQSHQIFVVGTASLFQFLVVAMLGFWAADWIHYPTSHQNFKWRNILTSPLHLSVLVFGLLAILATVVSITPAISFWGTWGRKSGLLTLICWIIFFLIVAQQLRHRAQLLRAIYTLLLSSGIVSVLGILQHFFPDTLYKLFHSTYSGRVFSTIGNPLFLSSFLAMVIPLNLALIVNTWNKWRHPHLISPIKGEERGRYSPPSEEKLSISPSPEGRGNISILIGLVILLALQFWCLWLAQYSITILLFIIAPIVFITLLAIVKRKKLALGFGAASLLALAVIAALLLVPLLSTSTSVETPKPEKTESIATAEDLGLTTLGWRVQYWHSAVDIVLKSPEVPFSNDRLRSFRRLIGYGPETFIVTFQLFFPEELKSTYTHRALLVDHPHNHYLYLATTMGLLGLMSFLSILAVFFYLSFRYLRKATLDIDKLLLIAMVSSIAQYMADSLFNPSTLSSELVFWLMLSLVLVIGRLTSSDEFVRADIEEVIQSKSTPAPHIARTRSFLSLGCTIILIIVGIGITIKPFLADMYLQKGLNLQAARSQQAIYAFDKAVKMEPKEAAYWSFLGAYEYSLALGVSDQSLKTEILTLSTAAYEEARELEPYIAYRYHSLADVYTYWAKEGAVDKWPTALSLYEKASQLIPRNAVILNKWSLALIIKGDFSQARDKLDYAASIDPDWVETTFLSGLLLAKEGKDDEAASEIIEPIQNSSANINYFIDLCRRLAVYDMVRPLDDALKSYAQTVPNEWITHAMLGVTSLFVGSPDKSLEEFNSAMLLVPDENVNDLFRAILRLFGMSPNFRTLLPTAAPDWRAKLIQSPQRDTLLPLLDALLSTSTHR